MKLLNMKLPATYEELVEKYGDQSGVPAIGSFFISYHRAEIIKNFGRENETFELQDSSFSLNRRIASPEEREGSIFAENIAIYESGEEPSPKSDQSIWITNETFGHTPLEDQDFANAVD